MVCAFTEFSDPFNSTAKTFQPNLDNITVLAKNIRNSIVGFHEAQEKYIRSQEYIDAFNALEKELFWIIGTYNATIQIEYNDGNSDKKATFEYSFAVNQVDYQNLLHNMRETLIAPLKNEYVFPYSFRTIQVELNNKLKD